MDQAILDQVSSVVRELPGRPNVARLSPDELRERAERFGVRTEFGNYNFCTSVKNLSTAMTVYIGGEKVEASAITQKKRDIRSRASDTVERVADYVLRTPMVRLDCRVGSGAEFSPKCSLFLSTYRPSTSEEHNS